jgi:hypothetical protein
MYRRIALLLSAPCAFIHFTGCAFTAPTYSLSPAVRESADQYSQTMDEFSDRVLLANVLRARDNAPLNFNDLTTLNGSFSVSGSLGFTVPFGHFVGEPTTYPYTASPMISGSSSPTLTMSTLNTQGFILTLLQPISPTYVLSKWNAGYDHELLLYLFIKSIKFCDDTDRNGAPPNCKDSLQQALVPLTMVVGDYTGENSRASLEFADADALEQYLNHLHSASIALHIASQNVSEDPVLTAVIGGAEEKVQTAYTQVLSADTPNTSQVRALVERALDDLKRALEIRGASSSCEHLSTTRIHLNNPDDKNAMDDFRNLVNCLADRDTRDGGDVDMKALMILDPLGNPLPYGESISVSTPASPQSPSAANPSNAQNSPNSQNPQNSQPGQNPAPTNPLPASPVTQPVVGVANGCFMDTGSYSVSITYVSGSSESLPSQSKVEPVTAGQCLTVAPPGPAPAPPPPPALPPANASAPPPTPTHYNVYVAASPGAAFKQNPVPIPLADPWAEPPTGLVLSSSQQSSANQTLPPPRTQPDTSVTPGSHRVGAAYYAKITFVAGTNESLPSPEAPINLADDSLLRILPPTNYPATVTHYNVYLGSSPDSETRQNASPIAIKDPWTQPASGPALVSLYAPPSATQYVISTPGSQNTVGLDTSIVSTINGLADGQLHIGNAACPSYLTDAHLCAAPSASAAPYVQLYREYPAQVVLCVHARDDRFDGHVIMPVPVSELEDKASAYPSSRALLNQWRHHRRQVDAARANHAPLPSFNFTLPLKDFESTTQMLLFNDLSSARLNIAGSVVKSLAAGPKAGASTAGGGGGNNGGSNAGGGAGGAAGGGGGGGSGTGNTAGAMPAVSLALIPNRVSAILESRACIKDQIVLASSTEEQFDIQTTGFAHIEWRSISEVIRYLGAIARNQDDGQVPRWPLGANNQQLFNVLSGHQGHIAVHYHGSEFSVPDEPANAADHSQQALALLNELISIAKISSNLPVTQPVEVLP